MTENKPVQCISVGAIKVSIWQSESTLGKMYRFSACRVYKDDDRWGRSSYFSQFDLPLLFKALQLCQDWIKENTDEDDVIRLPQIGVEDHNTANCSN